MSLYTQEQIEQANQMDLISYLKGRGERFEKSGREYRWKLHDSVTVNGNRWYQHSQGKGGYPIDFLQEFYNMTFQEAMAELVGEPEESLEKRTGSRSADRSADCLKDSPASPAEIKLPEKYHNCDRIRNYLCSVRKLDAEIVEHFIDLGEIYESEEHHVVFVGKDRENIPRFAGIRGIGQEQLRMDVKGSLKEWGFHYTGGGQTLYVFEAPIDMLSFICLYPENWETKNYVSLSGCSGKAMEQFWTAEKCACLNEVILCLDADHAGDEACKKLVKEIPDTYTVSRIRPALMDWNEVLKYKAEFQSSEEYRSDIKIFRRSKDYVKLYCFTEIQLEEITFLWEPYIPYGKITIIQGNPGDGKTYLSTNLVASATNRKPLATGEILEPVNVIYQNAEDGLGDTIRPRLEEAGADLSRVYGIDEGDQPLTLDDRRLELGIKKVGAKLVIIDPLQAYIDKHVDMSKPNGCRAIFRKLHQVASSTGAAIILVGHLNKNNQASSLQRGLGSMDITASARSILLLGRLKDNPERRIMVHDKCNIAAKGISQSFSLETERGFYWTGPYDVDGDQLLSGTVKDADNVQTKMEQAINLVRDALEDGSWRSVQEINEMAVKQGISERTMRDARKRIAELEYDGKGSNRKMRIIMAENLENGLDNMSAAATSEEAKE